MPQNMPSYVRSKLNQNRDKYGIFPTGLFHLGIIDAYTNKYLQNLQYSYSRVIGKRSAVTCATPELKARIANRCVGPARKYEMLCSLRAKKFSDSCHLTPGSAGGSDQSHDPCHQSSPISCFEVLSSIRPIRQFHPRNTNCVSFIFISMQNSLQ